MRLKFAASRFESVSKILLKIHNHFRCIQSNSTKFRFFSLKNVNFYSLFLDEILDLCDLQIQIFQKQRNLNIIEMIPFETLLKFQVRKLE